MPCVDKVLVVGGGIAGLTAACALAVRGMDCEVAEIAGAPVGAAIMISDRALDALDSIGVMARFEATGAHNPLGMRALNADRSPSFRRSIAQYRPVFSNILLERAVDLGASVRTGVGVVGLRQDDHRVIAEFSDGGEGSYDLVIGADGIRSTVRGLLWPDVHPVYAGQSNIRWMTPGPAIDLPGGSFEAPFGKLLSYPLPVQDLIYAITVFTAEEGQRVSQEEARRLLRRQLASMAQPYAAALLDRLTPDIELIYRPFEWLMLPAPWFKGRVVLIGDAAHATTAHMSSGGGMAIEDAVVLAEELASGSALEGALQAFMNRRLDRVRLVVETSLAISRMEQQGAELAEVRAVQSTAFAALASAY